MVVISPSCEIIKTPTGLRHFDVLKPRDDSVFLDIGAMTGTVSLEAARLANNLRFILIEPNPTHIPELAKNMKGMNATICTLAVGDQEGEAFLYSIAGEGKGGSLNINYPMRLIHGSPITASYNVKLTTTDKVLETLQARPDFVKIDTEGFEYYILKGFSLFDPGTQFHIEYHWNLPELLMLLADKNINLIRLELWDEFDGNTGAIHGVAI